MKKRLLSILLVMCMVLSLLPGTALGAVVPTSGKCGNNLTWSYSDGTLTIEGTGNMYNYTSLYESRPSPWTNYRKMIHTVRIGENVTSFGDFAFWEFSLTSMTIPTSITNIGEYAFASCSRLTNVTIPNSITSIEADTFHGCSSLTSVTIPKSVTSIGDHAFYGCSSLTSMTIPNSVTSIGQFAFERSGLTSVTVPDSITSIGQFAFYGCISLTSVTIPHSVTSIEDRAFSSCSNLTDVYYSGSETDWKAISIDSGNSDLTNATIHYNDTAPDEGNTPPGGEDNPGDKDTPVGEITLQLDSDTISVGNEAYITALFSHDGSFQQKDVTWSSNDESIVSIVTYGALISDKNASSTTTIKGISEGTATITVSLADGRSASCKVIVGPLTNGGVVIRPCLENKSCTN